MNNELRKYAIKIISLTMFCLAVVLFASFKKYGVFQELYHLFWQWMLIHISAFFFYGFKLEDEKKEMSE